MADGTKEATGRSVRRERDRERRGEPREERDQGLKGKAFSKEANFLWEAGPSSGRRVPRFRSAWEAGAPEAQDTMVGGEGPKVQT